MTTPRRAGIPTLYNGITFRSQLEARWANFFDRLDWRWEYEPFEGHGYIPDFVLLGDRPVAVEVKPAHDLADMRQHTAKVDRGLSEDVWPHDVIIVGIVALMLGEQSTFGRPALGLLGEWNGGSRVWDEGQWHACTKCGAQSFHHITQSFASRRCGHYDGDHYLGQPDVATTGGAWVLAGESTRWKPRRK